MTPTSALAQEARAAARTERAAAVIAAVRAEGRAAFGARIRAAAELCDGRRIAAEDPWVARDLERIVSPAATFHRVRQIRDALELVAPPLPDAEAEALGTLICDLARAEAEADAAAELGSTWEALEALRLPAATEYRDVRHAELADPRVADASARIYDAILARADDYAIDAAAKAYLESAEDGADLATEYAADAYAATIRAIEAEHRAARARRRVAQIARQIRDDIQRREARQRRAAPAPRRPIRAPRRAPHHRRAPRRAVRLAAVASAGSGDGDPAPAPSPARRSPPEWRLS